MNIFSVFKSANFLTVYTAFIVVWYAYGGFRIAYNGFFDSLLWGRLNLFFFLIFLITFFQGRKKYPHMFRGGERKMAAIFASVNALIYIVSLLIGGSLLEGTFVIYAFIGWAILCMNEESRMRVFDVFLAILIPLLVISAVEYLIFSITGNGIILGTSERKFGTTSGGSQVFIQLLFNLIRIDMDVPRFQSLFEEPSAVGNVAIFILFLTRNNNRYRVIQIITWIVGVISFSLGFYLLAAVYLLGQKIRIKYLLVAGLLLVLFIRTPFLVSMYENFIANRVEGNTIEVIDNRSSAELDAALANSLSDGSLWMGHGGRIPSSFQYFHGVSGAKPFLYSNGIILTVLTLSMYIIFILIKCRKYKLSYWQQMVYIIFFLLLFYKSAVQFNPYVVLMFFLYPYSTILGDDASRKKAIYKI